MDPQDARKGPELWVSWDRTILNSSARTHGAKTEFGKAGSLRYLINLQVHPQAVDG
jgi:hypothetical protein